MTAPLHGGESPGLAYLVRIGGRAGMAEDTARLVDRYRCDLAADPDAFHADADVLRSAAAVMRAHLLAQEQATARLRAAWSGDAADAALAALGRHLDVARAECDAVLAAARTLDDAGDLVRETSLARIEFVDRVFGQRVDDTDAGSPPAALAAHVAACLSALTDLVAVVETVVEEAGRAVQSAIEAVCAPTPPGVAAPPADAGTERAAAPVLPDPAVLPDSDGADRSGGPAGSLRLGPGAHRRDPDTHAPAGEPDDGPAGDGVSGAELAGAGPL